MPRVAERNGPICCYRIYLIRLVNDSFIPKSPKDMDILTYTEVHNMKNSEGGAYIASIIPIDQFQSEIPLGTDFYHKLPTNIFSYKCSACLMNLTRKKSVIGVKKAVEKDRDYSISFNTIDNHAAEPRTVDIFDGPLDVNSVYSGFVEVIVERDETDASKTVSVFGDYFPQQSPQAPAIPQKDYDQVLMITAFFLSGLIRKEKISLQF